MRASWGSAVLYPCEGNQTAGLVAALADYKGIAYIRTTRMKTPVIYGTDEAFPLGGSRVLCQSDDDRVTLIGAGVTVHEPLSAAERLAAQGIAARAIDCYSVKPIDAGTTRAAIRATGGRVVVAEDYSPEGVWPTPSWRSSPSPTSPVPCPDP